MPSLPLPRLEIDGRFLRAGDQRVFLKCVTYGPFPAWWTHSHESQFRLISAAGFNAVRLYERPSQALLDAAFAHQLYVIVTLPWGWGTDFIGREAEMSKARSAYQSFLSESGAHPSLAAVIVANEIPPDMVRWMSPLRVLEAIEDLIAHCRKAAPQLLYAYGNFPTTEYLEPTNADFTALNVYLEKRSNFSRYLDHLQVIAGDRPLFISEMGLDSNSASQSEQAELLKWQMRTAATKGLAGSTVYAWSDAWQNGPKEMTQWAFGITNRKAAPKPAYETAHNLLPGLKYPKPVSGPKFSVIICTYNGAGRIASCLESLQQLNYSNYEILVVDDGSTDQTIQEVENYPEVTLIKLRHLGLSVARNEGARAATGEIIAYTDDDCQVDRDWLNWLALAFEDDSITAAGGPNLPPAPEGRQEAIVAAASGSPAHVLLTDTTAEHVPGCNLAIRKSQLLKLGCFNPVFETAGDDVDLCWRLIDAGQVIRFIPQAFVWHRRRVSIWRYIQQQRAYGKAEAELRRLHPQRFSDLGSPRWNGSVYCGGPLRAAQDSTIYHGIAGSAPYQALISNAAHSRKIAPQFDTKLNNILLKLGEWLAQLLRSYERTGEFRQSLPPQDKQRDPTSQEWSFWSEHSLTKLSIVDDLRKQGWKDQVDDTHWDLTKAGTYVLIVVEQTNEPGQLTRVRISPDSNSLSTLQELKRFFTKQNFHLQ